MTTERRIVDRALARFAPCGDVSARAMFGEYALYLEGKLVALLCDNELFVKDTPAGRAMMPQADLQPPYPGAKPALRFSADEWSDDVVALLGATATALPAAKPKKR